MITNLLKGSNLLISTSAQDVFTIRLNWTVPDGYELDASAFMLTSSGKVPNDEAMIFFNQPKSVDNALHYDAGKRCFSLNLKKLNPEIQKISFTLTLYEGAERGQCFKNLNQAVIEVFQNKQKLGFKSEQKLARYQLVSQELNQETALIFAELYLNKGQWKFRAVGQGFNGGLAALCGHFCVDVAEASEQKSSVTTSLFGTIPALTSYSFQEQQQALLPGKSTENHSGGCNCNSGIKAEDQIGNLALVATFFQNDCYVDGRYNHNNYLAKRGVVKSADGSTSFAAYNISEPAKKASQWLGSTHVIFYKFPTVEDYSVYTFNPISKEINKIASIGASRIITGQFTKIAKANVSEIKGSLTYIFAPSSQRISIYTNFSANVEGAKVAETSLLTINKLRYSITGNVYDTRTGFNQGPNDWDNMYGHSRHFFLHHNPATKKIAIVWQDQSSLAIYLTWTNKTGCNSILLPNSRTELLAAATFDDRDSLYYLTIQRGDGKPNNGRTATLYKTGLSGNLINSRSLDTSKSGDGLDMVGFKPNASLQYANGMLGLMLGRYMFQSDDGLNHQGGIAVVFNANTLEQQKNWGQTSGHSFGNVMICNAAHEFIAMDLGDNYPRGVHLHRFTQNFITSKLVYAVKTQHGTTANNPAGTAFPSYDEICTQQQAYYKWSNDNSTYAELGGIVESADGYSIFFIGEPDANKKALNNARVGSLLNDARNIGMVKVKREFAPQSFSQNNSTAGQVISALILGEIQLLGQLAGQLKNYITEAQIKSSVDNVVLSDGVEETGGYYAFAGAWIEQKNTGIVWQTDYADKELKNASRLKAVKIAENKILLLWEVWKPSTYVNTFAMLVDSLGHKLSFPVSLGTHVRLSRSDDPLVRGNNVYLVMGNQAESKLEIVELEIK